MEKHIEIKYVKKVIWKEKRNDNKKHNVKYNVMKTGKKQDKLKHSESEPNKKVTLERNKNKNV